MNKNGRCQKCNQNFVLNKSKNKCVKCSQNCLKCSHNKSCDLCKNSYFLQFKPGIF